MQELLRSQPMLRADFPGAMTISGLNGSKSEMLRTDFGEVLAPVNLDEIAELKRAYSSLLVQLDLLRPQLAAADVPPEGDEEWSLREVLGHLIDSDRDIWWPRISMILQQDRPVLANVDQQELLRKHHWRSIPLYDILAQLMRTRWNFALKLQELSTKDFERTGSHSTLGEISILRILQILVAHDSHYMEEVRSVVELTAHGSNSFAE